MRVSSAIQGDAIPSVLRRRHFEDVNDSHSLIFPFDGNDRMNREVPFGLSLVNVVLSYEMNRLELWVKGT